MSEQFFIIGAQRSGTTYLYRILDQHPQIEMAKPVRPEPKFFLKEELFDKGPEYYRAHYYDQEAVLIRGEKSTSYIESEMAAKRIARVFPRAKILVMLRNPIRRAISNYRFSVENGLETLPMEQAFLTEKKRLDDYNAAQISASPFAYLQRGHYLEYLQTYRHYFPDDQIKVLVTENVVGNPAAIADLYSWLGVETDHPVESLHEVVNSSTEFRYEISSELQRFLQDYFRERNRMLAERFGLDIRQWKKP